MSQILFKMIKVSTITPCYKMGKYLETFLKEIENQTLFPHFEVIIDHNDPEDWEIELVKKYIKKYPNGVIKHIITRPVDSIAFPMFDFGFSAKNVRIVGIASVVISFLEIE